MGCSDSEESAKKYMKKLYMEENKSLAQFSMAITKASIPDKTNRTMKLTMVSSDTGEDAYEERMSVELFNDFVESIESEAPVPKPFDEVMEDGWNGGMPYPSISHYKSGAGKNTPGEIEKVYVDGEMLKSVAILHDSPLGVAVWKAVNQDLEDKNKPLEERTFENPVRVSIGFLDLEHKHELDDGEEYVFTRSKLKEACPKCEEGINGKVYQKGQLVHLAFTRVPANPRTSVEVYRMSDEINTKKDDAKSIIGDLAEELVGKSTVDDEVLVVKTDDKDEDEKDSRDRKKKKDEEEMKSQTVPEKTEVVMEENQVVQEPVQEEKSVEAPTPAPVVKSAVELATEKLYAKLMELKSKGVTGDAAIKEIQPVFNEVGNVVKNELTNPIEAAAEVNRGVIREEIAAAVPEIVAQIMKAIPAAPTQAKSEVPVARSIAVERSAHTGEGGKELSQIEKIARQSVGLQQ